MVIKYGIPDDRIFEPADEDIARAAQGLQPLLKNMLIVPYKYAFPSAE